MNHITKPKIFQEEVVAVITLQKRVGIFIDDPNLMGATLNLNIRFNFAFLLQQIRQKGQVVSVKKLFIDEIIPNGNHIQPGFQENKDNKFWAIMKTLGFQIIKVPKKNYQRTALQTQKPTKSRTDAMMIVQIMEHLLHDDFDIIYLFSGDCDFQFLLEKIVTCGKEAVVYSAISCIAPELQKLPGVKVFLFDYLIDTELIFTGSTPAVA